MQSDEAAADPGQSDAAAYRAAADLKRDGELPKWVVMCGGKYLSNLIEQDQRRIKQRLRPMLGLKSFNSAEIVISGIKQAEKSKKGAVQIGQVGRGPRVAA